jgi:ssRNA-specific RNase YbeY (16S rRNA maturation enzyme)
MVALLIHGVLHLLGYDHERSARQAQIMFARERKLQARLCERGLLKV